MGRITSQLTSRHRDDFVERTVGESENYCPVISSTSSTFTVCYFGELVGMVGSMETKAPSGSTIMMAVFLQSGRNSLFFSILESFLYIYNEYICDSVGEEWFPCEK